MKKHIVGVVGVGIVGTAAKLGFERLGHRVLCHDIKYENSKIEDLLECEVIFICVPSPSREDGSCNTEIVDSVVGDLVAGKYAGIICIKSTVPPGTTASFKEKYNIDNLCFVPEFLRERCAIADFFDNHDVCIIGADGNNSEHQYELIKSCHGKLPKTFSLVTTTEAEFCKYFNNCYNAMLVTFANSFYTMCEDIGASYYAVKEACINRDHINDVYLDCNENLRGFGGMCLPKDTKAIDYFIKQRGLSCQLFETIIKENNKYKVTVFDGMRKGEE